MEKDTSYNMVIDSKMEEGGFINKAANIGASFTSFMLWCHSWICIIRDLHTCLKYLIQISSYIFTSIKNNWWDVIGSKISLATSFIITICINDAYKRMIKLFKDFHSFFLRLFQILFSPTILDSLSSNVTTDSSSKPIRRFRVKKKSTITGEDIAIVMVKLGLCLDHGPQWASERSLEIVTVFDESEPSLDEVREAFGVFDQNGDGFIDADELNKVMNSIGLTGFSKEECKRMIEAFDENGDGKIDVGEFIKLMEDCSCSS